MAQDLTPNLMPQTPSNQLTEAKNCYKAAADRPEIYLEKLRGKKVALVANQTSMLANRSHLVDYLLSQNIDIKFIFAPEHGFRGNADAGENVKSGIDSKTQLPIISLYGDKDKKPKAQYIKDIDVVLFDIQDVGVRFYTYISSLSYLMEVCAQLDKKVMVLDRPNPHDGYTDGPVLKPEQSSFVGLHQVPVVYGLTIGEYGLMVNGEGWLPNKMKCDYELIPMMGYHKKQPHSLPDRPSPNLPNDQSITLYPSLCFFEGTQVSLGRGTDFPFQTYGSPKFKNMAFAFKPQPNYGAKDPFLNGQTCYGEDLRKDQSIKQKLALNWLIKAYENYEPKADFFLKNLFFDKLAGNTELRQQLINHKTEAEIRASWAEDLQRFEKIRKKYVMYQD